MEKFKLPDGSILEHNVDMFQYIVDYDLERDHNLVSTSSLKESTWLYMNKKAEGYDTPWRSLKNKLLFVKGELTLLSGYTGNGKSEIVTHLAIHAISQGAKILLSSLEMFSGQIMGRVVAQASGCADAEKEHSDFIHDFYDQKLFIYNKCGTGQLDKIISTIEHAISYKGVDFVIIDNLMMLDDKVDDYNKQLANVQNLSALAKNRNIIILLVAHTKKPQKEVPIPGIYDVLGASAIANLVDNHFSLTINSQKLMVQDKLKHCPNAILSDSEEKYLLQGDSILKRDKKREYGEMFTKHLYYDYRFRRLKDYESEMLHPYVNYSKLSTESVNKSVENDYEDLV